MERRAVLKVIIAAGVALLFGGEGMQPVGSAMAGQAQIPPRARTTEQAIFSNNPGMVVDYVLKNQRHAGQSSRQEKVALLKIMKRNWHSRVGFAHLGLEGTAEYERAMLILLRGEDEGAVLRMLHELGGPGELDSGLQHVQNRALRITLDKALSR